MKNWRKKKYKTNFYNKKNNWNKDCRKKKISNNKGKKNFIPIKSIIKKYLNNLMISKKKIRRLKIL